MSVNALDGYISLVNGVKELNFARGVHRSSYKRRQRKLAYKEQWIVDAFTALNLTQTAPRDVLARFFAGKDRIWVSRWKRNRIKLKALGFEFIMLITALGGDSHPLLHRVTRWAELLSAIRRFKGHINELRHFVNHDFLDRRDVKPYITERGKVLVLQLLECRSARKMSKHIPKFRYWAGNFDVVRIFDKYGYQYHPLVEIILAQAFTAQQTVSGFVGVENFSTETFNGLLSADWNSVVQRFSAVGGFPSGGKELSRGVLMSSIHSKIRRIMKLTVELLHAWKTEVRFEFGFSHDVRFRAEIGLNGSNIGLMHTVRSRREQLPITKFVRPTVFKDVKVIET